MSKILIVLGSSSDMSITEAGLEDLRKLGISYSLRICSAHRTPKALDKIVKEFLTHNGKVCICVAGMSAHLAGVVAAKTNNPVLAVPVYRKETSGLDSLLSMGQMPKGIPVGTMGFGKSGFINACLLSAQIIALGNKGLTGKLEDYREEMADSVMNDDKVNRQDFDE